MKSLLIATLALLSAAPAARAEKFECFFTEPFFTITYDTTSRKLVRTDAVMEKKQTFRNVQFYVMDDGQFKLVDEAGADLMTLKLTHNGSDGMGPTIYPYEARTALIGGANNGEGGCSSALLPTRQGEP